MEANLKIDKAVRTYLKKVEQDQHLNLSDREITYKEFLSNRMLIVHSIREGIPYRLFKLIQEKTPFSEEEWAEILNISTKTLQRYRASKNHVFKPIHSEKILELAEVTSLGNSVFGPEKFYLWLQTPNYALGNLKPKELLKDSYGKELVVEELHHIDQGIFA
ncbi:type II RES/Xre toxin-antitoxin system antitoxin [Salinimicrobium gaetbulicola]|uniref:Antitoxin Xre-like helix-turn-helix domain-containing protein n=1 Tax=Salinimicrobium gaetbulicola TaxID=999702 RepID=A0ABW3IG11_9FLAO